MQETELHYAAPSVFLSSMQGTILSAVVRKGHTTWLGLHKWLVSFRDSDPGLSDAMACALSIVLLCP